MALRIEAIASYCGLKGIFKLLAADIYEVLGVEESARVRTPVASRGASDAVFTTRAMQDLAERIHRAEGLEQLLDSILASLESFGFSHAMTLVPHDHGRLLVTIASRGYEVSGVGAEVRVGVGDGIAGMVAEGRKPIRISGLLREMLVCVGGSRASTGTRRMPRRAPHCLAGPEASGESARRAPARPGRTRGRAAHRKRDTVSLP
jgi:adenylate cyclase